MSEILLPVEKTKAELVNPETLVIYGPPKVGKTSLLAQLPDSLLVDIDKGTKYVDAVKYEINDLDTLLKLVKKVKDSGSPYKFGILDTVTELEPMVNTLALKLYRATPIGAKFGLNPKTGKYEDKNILTLPNGAGYLYIREAFFKVIDYFNTAFKYKIYVGHLKDAQINEETQEVIPANIDLTGKLKMLICSKSDSIGYIYRKGLETHMSFVATNQVACGSRSAHLRNQDIVVAEMNAEGVLTTHWDKIYLNEL